MKQALLVVNLGTPNSPNPKDVKKYLKEFLLDPNVIDIPWALRQLLVRRVIVPKRYRSSAEMYKEIWTENGSPLLYYTQELTRYLKDQFEPDVRVEFAMRYQVPSIRSKLKQFEQEGIEEMTVLPLFPQYANATSGSILKKVAQITGEWKREPKVLSINQFATLPAMINTFARNGHLAHQYDHVLFSFHGLPQRQLVKNDNCKRCMASPNCCENRPLNENCYRSHCIETAKGIAQKLALDPAHYTICFQSRLGRAEWLKPYASETIESLAKKGVRSLLVFSPSFVCDCLETLFEIEREYRDEFLDVGGEKLDLVPSLNLDPEWLEGLSQLIREKMIKERQIPQQALHHCVSGGNSH